MPYLFVYSPDDFVESLPAEVGTQADGSPDFSLTLWPGATPTLVEVSDDDLVFDEIDGSQTLSSAININGSAFSSGTSINTAYDLINTTTGHKVTSFHCGTNGESQGPVDGLVSTIPLEENQTYTFDSERTSNTQNNEYTDYVACFASGTLIDTADGPVEVQHLEPGDQIKTCDSGLQRLRYRVSRCICADELMTNPKLYPVRIRPGALRPGFPRRSLLVSQQHRILVSSHIVSRMFGSEEVLVAAKKLLGFPKIELAQDVTSVVYNHLLLDRHEIIFAEGIATESFYYGEGALGALSKEALEEIKVLFPFLLPSKNVPRSARQIPPPRRQKRFAERQSRNSKINLQQGNLAATISTIGIRT